MMTQLEPGHPPGVFKDGEETVRFAHVTDEQIKSLQPRRALHTEPQPQPKTVTIGRGTYILLVASSAVAGFIGAALGMVAVMIW